MNICNGVVSLIKSRLDDILALRGTFSKKPDNSFVSEGDLLVQQLVFDYLSRHLPTHELISEELAPFGDRVWDSNGSYVVLDPIDGTENFISGLREWGVGISIYTAGRHVESCIYLPELNEYLITGMACNKYISRIHGLSSSLTKQDLQNLPESDAEFRIIGCSMYNMLSAVKGSFKSFTNVKGVNSWDVLPGLNLALEHGSEVEVDGNPYAGEILFPVKKYKIRLSN